MSPAGVEAATAPAAEGDGAGRKDSFVPPVISVPKGGGAIRGIGEKFATNPVTGTASMTVPIATSAGRSGFGPELSLSYDSGSANGPFGFGWSLGLPSITRKTDKGLPRYRDGDESDPDVYLLSGAEDLVPVMVGLFATEDFDLLLAPIPASLTDAERQDRIREKRVRLAQALRYIPRDPASLSDDLLRQELALVLPADVAETFLSMWSGTVEYEAIVENVPPGDQLDPADFAQDSRIRTSYDESAREQRLTFRGVLVDPEKAEIMAAHPFPVLTALLDSVHEQARTFFETRIAAGSQRRHCTTATLAGSTWRVERYRPRVEGLFARIERWTNVETGEIHWRSISGDNVTTVYGATEKSRIADPADPLRIFSWLISESYDDKGNAIVYEHVAENGENVDRSDANERNRVRTAARYLKRIKYGNRVSRLVEPDLTRTSWMFEVVFDYDESHYEELDLDPAHRDADQHRFVRASASAARSWAIRPDPSSTHRAGFEVRTYRRCRRVLIFHHVPDLPTGGKGYDGLVRSTEFDYGDLDDGQSVAIADELAHQGSTRFGSFIRAVTQSGYVRDHTRRVVVRDGVQYATYLKKSLPPLEFEYSKATVQDEVLELDPASLENLPEGLDQSTYQWVDLHGEGISGILTEQAGAWLYKPNLGDGRFGPLQTVPAKPSLASLSGGRQQLLDLAGDGQLDLVALQGPTPGFYERTYDEDWDWFRAFRHLPNIPWDDPNLRFVDLDGDGHADVLVTEQDVFTWYPSRAEEGFGPARRVSQVSDEERGPRLILADGTQSIYLADMCGDGLTDLVRIRNGEVCYWPNLGHCRFGAKVTMDNSPWFDEPEQFDQRRVRLADIDGSGANDVIYLARESVRLYFNQSGNRLSDALRLSQLPHVDNASSVITADLLGNGTACLVWSSPLAADARRPLRYIDLMGGGKPHLLIAARNNLGAETRLHYAPSTRFYLEDKRGRRPWITRLPFPVHVVERVETYDFVSRNRFVARYAYHHGHFDGVEREFRGFGLVERRDTEEFAALSSSDDFPVGDNVDAASHVPPVLTRTWFHTGAFVEDERVSRLYQAEYYRPPGVSDDAFEALLLPDTTLPAGLDPDEEPEAARALKGSVLREEVYALDGSPKAALPYRIAERNYSVVRLQPRGSNENGVFFVHPAETVDYQYERVPDDPRVTHNLTLEVDAFGNVLKSASVAYGRRTADTDLAPEDRAAQGKTWITYTESRFTNAVSGPEAHRAPLPAESRTYELTGVAVPQGRPRFSAADLLSGGEAAAPLAYEATSSERIAEKRTIEWVRTLYRPDDLVGALPLGRLESLGLRFESYKLALTPGFMATAYGTRVTGALLETEGGYVGLADTPGWWVGSGRMFYAPATESELPYARAHFFLPHRYRDAFHTAAVPTEASARYDGHDLLVEETRDALGNRFTAGERDVNADAPLVVHGNDYRVLQPRLVMDPNRNRSEIAYDALAFVVGTAVMGKPGTPAGESLEGFEPDLTDGVVLAHLADPLADPHAILKRASTRIAYDLLAYHRSRLEGGAAPVVGYTLVRETHDSELASGATTPVQHTFSYSDGFGREIQQKLHTEAGPVPRRDENGEILLGAGGRAEVTASDVSPRWIGSGWAVFTNKGKTVRQYEPFFTDTQRFEFDVRIGLSPVVFYDPLDRAIGTLHPNHTWEKTVFDAWSQEIWDVNDTALEQDPKADAVVGDHFDRLPDADYLPTWHDQRKGGALGPHEQAAARKTAVHARTATVSYSDSLGRKFLAVAHNRFKYGDAPEADPPTEELHHTRTTLDVEGNERAIVDAKGRVVVRNDYDMLGTLVRRASMEAGERWTLTDVAGKPIYTWDSRGHRLRTAYDALRRPTDSFLREGGGGELLVGRVVYGENRPDGEAANVRGKLLQHFDQAGVVTSDEYDFKGNLLRSERRFAETYESTLDWSAPVTLQTDAYTTRARYDALNRLRERIGPDKTVVRFDYNETGLIQRIEANLRGARGDDGRPVWTPFVTDVDYDARGQRTLIEYGSGATDHGQGVTTTYTYDPVTLRLRHLLTRRGAGAFPGDCPQAPGAAWPGCHVQSLSYTYDPVGNITHLRDDAQQTIFFKNRRVEPSADYMYDATYRLIEAQGREHLGQVGAATPPTSYNDRPRLAVPLSASDGNAMGRFLERYLYDAAGNFEKVIHRGSDPANAGWTRSYVYDEASALEGAQRSNRLTRTTVGGTTETYSTGGDGYDTHGNMLRMPQLQVMQWNFNDQLQMTQRQAVGAADEDGTERHGERTWYIYDAGGERVRKVTELSSGAVKHERLYLGDFEIFRSLGANTIVRETLHIKDESRRVALVETRTQGTERGVPAQLIRNQLDNHLGSALLELDDRAQVVSYEEYYPYGSTSYQAVQSQTETPKRYRYAGKERDGESGLYYHGARYYAPWLGRWTRPDPLHLRDSTNVYLYSRNTPIIAKDPTGGPAWFIPVIGYLAYKAFTSGVETGVEAGIAKATGDEQFSAGGTFLKNFVVNSTVGLIPGTSEAKIGVKVAVYGGKLALRTTADATLDTVQGKGEFTDNFLKSGLGNVGGDVVGVGFKKVAEKTGVGDKLAGLMKSKVFTERSVFARFPVKQVLQTKGIDEQVEFLAKNVPGLTKEQARAILDAAFSRKSTVVIGGSRIRGDFETGSDIDVGFGNLSERQAQRVIRDLNKAGHPLKLEELTIVPGKQTATIGKIETPEEFFQRSGTRAGGDLRAGEAYVPSGSVTLTPGGAIDIRPPEVE